MVRTLIGLCTFYHIGNVVKAIFGWYNCVFEIIVSKPLGQQDVFIRKFIDDSGQPIVLLLEIEMLLYSLFSARGIRPRTDRSAYASVVVLISSSKYCTFCCFFETSQTAFSCPFTNGSD